MGSGRSSSFLFKTIFGTLVALGFIIVFLVAALHSTLATDSEHVKVLGKGKLSSSVVASRQMDLNYMNKRGVPNGPDPIHNRRAGNSRQPSGRT